MSESNVADRITIYNAIQTAIAGTAPLTAIEALLDALGAVIAMSVPTLEGAQELANKVAPNLIISTTNNFVIARDRRAASKPGNA